MLEQVVGFRTREGGPLILPGETAPFVLGLLEGPVELLADQGATICSRGAGSSLKDSKTETTLSSASCASAGRPGTTTG